MTTQDRNPLVRLMNSGRSGLLNIYFTAGYPGLNDTSTVLETLQESGADMIEIGMPFSDPLADGPTIQKSNMEALSNGMSIEVLFDQLSKIEFTVPVILMGYLNPVLSYGLDAFCSTAAEIGVSGLILPDLPTDLYAMKYEAQFNEYDLCNISLITPHTSHERVIEIDRHTRGFIYAVSSASTTGNAQNSGSTTAYIRDLSALNLQNPIMTGFNIRDKASFESATEYSRGGIIGSAFIRNISQSSDLKSSISGFVNSIRL